MKIGFVNFTPFIYSVNTPHEEPLGGSESSLCYLAEALAKRGHQVILFGRLPNVFTSRDVRHEPDINLKNAKKNDLDGLIIQNTPYYGVGLRAFLENKTKLIFWNQHAPDQPAVASLNQKNFQEAFDGFTFVSKWQMDNYISHFGIDKKKSIILRNAISPAFENLYKEGENILLKKSNPPVVAYTSAPFRGLELLIKLFPQIRKKVPGTILKVFSSMKVYQASSELEQKEYGYLYSLCKKTEGVEYVGSIPQPELAKRLQKASILVYPNIFAETSCISIMEAMAAGCQIITSDLGALPETTVGYAKLIPMNSDYDQNFIDATVNTLKNPINTDKQVDFVRKNYTWTKRSVEWEGWLKGLI